MKRSAAIYILTIIAAIAGIVAIIDAMRYLGFLFSPFSFLGSPFLGAALSGLAALIWFWAASRVWNRDPRGWLFMVSIAAIYLVIDFVALLAGTPIEFLLTSVVINGLIIIVCLLPSTNEEFGAG